MQRLRFLSAFLISTSVLLFSGCETLLKIAEDATKSTGPINPTTAEIVSGLKEALVNGTSDATSLLSKTDGYLKDPQVKIPFPADAQFAADKLRDIGLGSLVDDFVERLNHGAEEGAKQAFPIFKNAITQMTITDAKDILITSQQDAATKYFQRVTSQQLYNAFSPKIKTALDQVNATKIWSDVTTRYNQIPFTQKKIETDLVKYATNKALDGLFLKVAQEEADIRSNLNARTSDLLQKVFDYADRELGK